MGAAIGAALLDDGLLDEDEVTRAQAGRVGAAAGHQRLGGDAAGPQRLAQPLQVGPGVAGPVLEHLAQPAQLDRAEVDGPLGGRPAARAVGLQIQQLDPPHVAGIRVGAGVLGPGSFQMTAQVTEQALDGRVVLHATAFTHRFGVGAADRAGPVQAADEDPHLQRVQRRWSLIAALQRVEQLEAHQPRQASQRELVGRDPGLLVGDPRGQLLLRHRRGVALPLQPIAVEPAQPSPGDAFAAATGDQARLGTDQRPSLSDELLHRPATGLAPGPLVPETQATAMRLALAVGHRAAAAGNRAGRATPGSAVELLLADTGRRPGASATRAAAVIASGRRGAARSPAPPRRCPVVVQIAGEQPQRPVPLARPPRGIDMSRQPFQPASIGDQPPLGVGADQQTRHRRGHRKRSPAATASTARRLSSSRACRYTAVEAKRGVTQQPLYDIEIHPGAHPVRGRRMPEHMRPHRKPAVRGQPFEEPFRRTIGHRRAQRFVVEVDEHHVAVVAAEDLRAFELVVRVRRQHRLARRHGAGKPRLRQRAIGIGPVPHVNVSAQHRATHTPRIGKQVQIGSAQSESFPDPQPPIPQQSHHESFPRPATARRDPFGLLGSERLGKRRLRPRLERPGPDHPELAGLSSIETRRGETQPAGFGQPVGDGLLDHPGPGAEPQELAHRGEDRVYRCARTQPPVPARGGFDEMLETGQARQTDGGPLHPLVGAPAQEARHPPGIGTDRVGRTPGPMQRPQEVAGLPVHHEPGVKHHPQLGSIEG